MSTLFVVQEKDFDVCGAVGLYTSFIRALSAAIKAESRGATDYGLSVLKYVSDEDIQLHELEEYYCILNYPDRVIATVDFVEVDEHHNTLEPPYMLIAISNEFIRTYPEVLDIASTVASVSVSLGFEVTKRAAEVDDVNTVFELRKV